MALRRSAIELAGPFDESFSTGGDEEEWLRRLTGAGGKVLYVADAPLDHRRAGDDARLRSLMRSAYRRGRNVGAYDRSRGTAPGCGRTSQRPRHGRRRRVERTDVWSRGKYASPGFRQPSLAAGDVFDAFPDLQGSDASCWPGGH